MLAYESADLISVTHEVVNGDETFEDDDPVGVLGALEQQVGQGRYRHVRLLCAVKEIWKKSYFV